MPEKGRYIAELGSREVYVVNDTKENRIICYCTYLADAKNIAKAMNVSDSWDPILMTNEMGPSNYIKKED